MIKDSINLIVNRFTKPGTRYSAIIVVIFTVIIAPLVISDYASYRSMDKQFRTLIESRRESLAHLAATLLAEKFDRITDIGVAFSSRITFRKYVEDEKWDEAMGLFETILGDYKYIDSVALFDPSGILKASLPNFPTFIGQDLSHREYYKGVSKEWKPYVSGVFKRLVEPKYNVITVSIPIKSNSSLTSNEQVLGIMVIGIRLDTLLYWSRDVDVGRGGYAYFVDNNGNAAGHPKYLAFDDVVNVSELPVVRRLLNGERGVDISFNKFENEELISAFEFIPKYGWGVIIQQPTSIAYEVSDENAYQHLIKDSFILLAVIILILFVIKIFDSLIVFRRKEKALLEGVGDAIVVIDRKWNILIFNKSAEEITGWSRADAIGKQLQDVVKFTHSIGFTESTEFIKDAMASGSVQYLINHKVIARKDKQAISVEAGASPILNNRNKVIGIVITFRNVTQLQKAQMLSANFQYASKQFQLPSDRALWSLDLIMKEKHTKEVQEQANIAFIAVKSIQKLSEDIIAISQIDQGNEIPHPEPIMLGEVLGRGLKEIELKAKEKGNSIIVAPECYTVGINTDKKLLRRVLVELLDNAISYSHPKGDVDVKVVFRDEGVILSIKDHGIGIPIEQQSLIFTRFYRGSNFNAIENSGSGLGLNIAREYVTLLGGKIWFESTEGKGTTFYVFLPA